jgi:hypothetical protein
MNLTMEQIEAIYQLYPTVITIRGDVAYDADGNEVSYDIAAVDEQADKNTCKQQAQQILYKTDWTTIPDVADPTYTPYLMNQTEFKQYRAVVRGYAVNPVANPTWPVAPTEQWSS